MSHAEFVYWKAYAGIDPFGNVRGDLQTAMITSTMANIHRGAKQQAFKLSDFMLDFRPRRRLTTPEAQKEFFRQMTLAVGGTVVSKKAA